MTDGEITYSLTLSKTANEIQGSKEENSVQLNTVTSAEYKKESGTNIILDRVKPEIKFVQKDGLTINEGGKTASEEIDIHTEYQNTVSDVAVTDTNKEIKPNYGITIKENGFNKDVANTYNITYKAVDKAGNESEVITKTVTVKKITYKLDDLVEFNDASKPYNKGPQSIEISAKDGKSGMPDGIKATYTYYAQSDAEKQHPLTWERDVINAGTYKVVVTFEIDSDVPAGQKLAETYDNVVLTDNEATLEITKIAYNIKEETEKDVKFKDTSNKNFTFEYDGETKQILLDSETYPSEAINVSYTEHEGKDVKTYNATATLTINPKGSLAVNYDSVVPSTVKQAWEIIKGIYTIPERDQYVFEDTSPEETNAFTFKYDGNSHTIKLSNDHETELQNLGIKIDYTDNSETAVSKEPGYTAKATLSIKPDGALAANYDRVADNEITQVWYIIKGIYVLDNVKFEDKTFVYDGEEKEIQAESLPEGIQATYTYSKASEETLGQSLPTDVGKYEVTVKYSISEGSELETNYDTIDTSSLTEENEDLKATLTIKERKIKIKIAESELEPKEKLTSEYGFDINDLSSLQYDFVTVVDQNEENGYNVIEKDRENLGITFKANEASKTADAGNYNVTIEWSNENYDIDLTNGNEAYVITPQKLTIQIDSQGSVYGEKVNVTYSVSNKNGPAEIGGIEDISITAYVEKDGKEFDAQGSEHLPVGEYPIKVKTNLSGSAATNYEIINKNVQSEYTVSKRPITIKINDGQEALRKSTYKEELANYKGLQYTVQEDMEKEPKQYSLASGDVLDIEFALQDPSGLETPVTKESDAGTYNIILTGTEKTVAKNYEITLMEDNATYTIEKKDVQIKVTKGQSSVYGEKVVINYTTDGFTQDETNALTVTPYIEYNKEEYPNEAQNKHLPVGQYDVKVRYEEKGKTSTNYNITVAEGTVKYNVTARNIEITIKQDSIRTSVYNESLVLDAIDFDITGETSLASGEEKGNLQVKFGLKKGEQEQDVDGGKPLDADSYTIYAKSWNSNYNLTLVETNNDYTITKAEGTENPDYKSTMPQNLTTEYGKDKTLSSVDLAEYTGWSWKNGDTKLTVSQKTYKAKYTSSNLNYKDVEDVDITVTVTPKAINEENVTVTVTADSKEYDEKAATVNAEITNVGEGIDQQELTIGEPKYYKKAPQSDADDYTINLGNVAPTEVGEYKVVYEVTGNDNYSGTVTASATYEISAKKLTIQINEGQDVTSVYGEPLKSVENLTYTIQDNEDQGLTNEKLQVTFKLSEENAKNKGTYNIVIDSHDPNYDVTLSEENTTYTITARKVKVQINASELSGENLTSEYGYEINDLSSLLYDFLDGDSITYYNVIEDDKEGLGVTFTVKGLDESVVNNLSNAGKYNVIINWTDTNYELELTNGENAYTIKPQELTVKIENKQSVYGDQLESIGCQITNSKGQWIIGGGNDMSVTPYIEMNDGRKFEESGLTHLPVGVHKIKVDIKLNNEAAQNNFNITNQAVEGTYTVTARPVTIEITEVLREYNQEYVEPTYELSRDTTLASGEEKSILNISFKYLNTDGEGNVDINNTTPVGNYKIVPSYENSNYNVTFTPSEVYYKITQATPVVPEQEDIEADYLQTLGDVKSKLQQGFSFVDIESTPVGNVGTNQFDITYTNGDSNYKDVTSTVNINVKPIDPKASDVTYIAPLDLSYDGTKKEANVTVKEELVGIGEITNTKYYKVIGEQETLQEQGAIDAGKYIVKVDIAENSEDPKNYNAINDLVVGEFEISPKQITREMVKVTVPGEDTENKVVYDKQQHEATVEILLPNKDGISVDKVYKKKALSGEYTEQVSGIPTDVGEYQVTITVTATGNYTTETGEPLTFVESFEITKASQEITIKVKSGDQEIHDVTKPVETLPQIVIEGREDTDGILQITADPEGIVNIDNNQITALLGSGKVTITAKVTNSNNYEDAEVKTTLTVYEKQNAPRVRLSKSTAILTDKELPTFIFDESIEEKNVVYSLAEDRIVLTNEVITIEDGKIVSLNGEGTVTIYVKYAENEYLKESDVTKLILQVSKGVLLPSDFKVITEEKCVYDTTLKSASVTSAVDGVGIISVKYYQDGVEKEPINAGTYDIKVTVTEGTLYKGTIGDGLTVGSLVIEKADIALDADNKFLTYLTYKLDGQDIWQDVEYEAEKTHKVTVELNDTYAKDNRDGVSFVVKYNDSTEEPKDIATYDVTVEITCQNGNFENRTISLGYFKIQDTGAPRFITTDVDQGNKITKLVSNEPFDYAHYVTAIDDVDGPVPVTWTETVKPNEQGSYTVTYTATDLHGNTSTLEITVIIKNNPPRIDYVSKTPGTQGLALELTKERQDEFLTNPLHASIEIKWDRGNAVIMKKDLFDVGGNFEEYQNFTGTGILSTTLYETGWYKIIVTDENGVSDENTKDKIERELKIDMRSPKFVITSEGTTDDDRTFTKDVTIKILEPDWVYNAYVEEYDIGLVAQPEKRQNIILENVMQGGASKNYDGSVTYTLRADGQMHIYCLFVKGTNNIEETQWIMIKPQS